MHSNPLLRKGVIFCVLSLFLFAQCRKTASNTITDVDDNGGYAGDASRMEWITNDVISIADAAGTTFNGSYMRATNTFGACATVSTDTTVSPHLLIIRFGDVDCTCLDGRNRRGTIYLSYDGHYSDTQSLHTIWYENYHLNGLEVKGSIKTVRIDTTVVGNWYYNVTVDDTLVTAPNTYIHWQGNTVRRWIAGKSTGDRSDDVFSISGNATLTRPSGHIFTFSIGTPMVFALDCNYAETGVVTVNGYTGARILDYGTNYDGTQGGCNNFAQLTIGGHIYQTWMNY